jgi:tRNA A37 threonylcarbamoyladenosine modification protein TsaB
MTLGKPIVGVSALDALAWNALSAPEEQVHTILSHGTLQAPSATSVATWMDAQRGEVFSAIYRGRNGREWPWALATEPAVGLPGALLGDESFDRRTPMLFVGDGARRYAETIGTESPNWVISTHDRPLAPALAWIGRRLAAQGHATTPHALQPLYVRRPDAELERDRLINSSAARERERAAGSGDPAS